MNTVVGASLNGLFQIVERNLSLTGPVVPPDRRPKWRQALAMGVVFILVMWAWVPFRMEMPVAVEFWKQLLNFGEFGIRYRRLILAAGFVLASIALDIVQRIYRDEVVFLRWPRLVQAALLAAVVFFTIIVSQGGDVEPFVYQGF